MQSHPNFIGYDAIEGKPRHLRMRMPGLILRPEKLKASDFNKRLETGWLKRLEAVRVWCGENSVSFAISLHDYQLAKALSPDCTIVLWAAKRKPTKTPYIKPTFEGGIRHHSRAEAMMAAIKGLVA